MFELAIPIVGIPALHDHPEDESLLSVTLSGCSGEFSVRKDQQDDLLLLADNSKSGQRDYLAIVRRANSCQIDQCAKVVGRPCPLDEPRPIQQVNATPIPWTVAEEMFKLLAAPPINCDEKGLCSSDCIPFLFPDFGCEARAHKAWQILKAGFPAFTGSIFKLYISGHFNNVCTGNHPHEHVCWTSHVAPAVNVEDYIEPMVLDPALFCAPAKGSAWQHRIRGDSANPSYAIIPAWAFEKSENNGSDTWHPDDSLKCTNARLTNLRLNFEQRVCFANGHWPPYSEIVCP